MYQMLLTESQINLHFDDPVSEVKKLISPCLKHNFSNLFHHLTIFKCMPAAQMLLESTVFLPTHTEEAAQWFNT